jgi:hypothetical protein
MKTSSRRFFSRHLKFHTLGKRLKAASLKKFFLLLSVAVLLAGGAAAVRGRSAPDGTPTVTNVVVLSTAPDNGATPYNTGTVTVQITGTDFASVVCPGGVRLDDLDGAGAAVGTQVQSCTVDSDTQITATFPAGIRTNGTTGWNVKVTNSVGTNTTSAVKFVPRAGLLVGEVYPGTAGAADHEFVELYNPTATALNAGTLGIHLHIRNSTGTDSDKTLTMVTTGNIPSHGFLLFGSSQSTAADAWFSHRDYTYTAAINSLLSNGGVYLSFSATANVQVIDKVGWGTQPAIGCEGTALANIPSDNSAERKPAGGLGHATDTDSNAADFNAASISLTPHGSADPAEPPTPPTPTQIVSRKTHGSAGPFDIDLPLTGNSGIECRNGGATNDYQVVFTFASSVTFNSAAVTAGAGTVNGSSGSGTTAVTVNLTGITNAQRITVTLLGVSDGTRMGDLGVQMGVLVGDTNGNGAVSASDIGQTKAQSGQAATGANFRTDVNASGSISAADIGLVKSKSGTSLPP